LLALIGGIVIMLVSELITNCRRRINDVAADEVQNDEWIDYINQAIDQLSRQLITTKDPCMITETSISNGLTVFSNFEKFAGAYPSLYISGSQFRITGAGTPIVARWYGTKAHVALTTEAIPFKDSYAQILAQMAARFAKERISLQITDSTALLNEQVATINGAKA
jgi:hypothetical protein